ncbi:MAG: hypothetical protein L0I76_26850 [Pseudonocardia sp.]|nr:hypothetical protein [Pseudonocardia sp.]
MSAEESRPGTNRAASQQHNDHDDDTPESEGRGPTAGQIMRGLLDDHFTLTRSTDGRMFGVPVVEPGRAVQHDPRSSPLIRSVSRMFLDTEGKWPSTTGVAECSAYALAMFDDAPVRPVPLRAHWDRPGGVFYLDTCDERDTVLRVDATGLRAVDAPVAFRRAAVPAPMPWTTDPGTALDLAPLWELVPVAVDDRPLVLALMLTAWMTDTPQPVVTLTGPQDSGKTSTGRYLLSYVDPTTGARGRSLPADEREWKAAVAHSRAVLVDNLSGLDAESSDMLCRVATGGEAASRQLYTDDASHVSNLHVPVWLTTIDPGALRGDLASRMVKVELTPLNEGSRLAESELSARQEAIRPQVMRGLLWLAVQVLAAWPGIDKAGLAHRMGDFAIAVRCVDQVLGTTGEKRLAVDAQDLAADVVDASPLALAVVELLTPDPVHGGVKMPPRRVTAGELLELLDKARADADPWRTGRGTEKGWPRTPKILSAALTRIEPALRQAHGIAVERTKSNGTKYVRLHLEAAAA